SSSISTLKLSTVTLGRIAAPCAGRSRSAWACSDLLITLLGTGDHCKENVTARWISCDAFSPSSRHRDSSGRSANAQDKGRQPAAGKHPPVSWRDRSASRIQVPWVKE